MADFSLPGCVNCKSPGPERSSQEPISLRQLARGMSRMRLKWDRVPESILIVYREGSSDVVSLVGSIRSHLRDGGTEVDLYPEDALPKDTYDLIITVGGDGTVLLAAWMFQKTCPPILPLFHGTLGFLTMAPAETFPEVLRRVLQGGTPRINIRMRILVQVHRLDGSVLGRTVLNDLVIDRGATPHMAYLDIYGDHDHYLTTLSGDGLVISTPTGSTAYSMSAGGSMVHPDVPAVLITPICPHSLSFRPLVFPDWMDIRLVVSEGANRSESLWASFDGRERIEVRRGEAVTVSMSPYPVSTICDASPTADWHRSLGRCLAWNQRQ